MLIVILILIILIAIVNFLSWCALMNQIVILRADVEILKEFQGKDIVDYVYKKGFKSEAEEYAKYLKERKKDV